MATLEKIRSKQKILFGIVLGALVLFIVSIIDAGSIRNIFGAGPNPTVAEVGGVKVDHETYRKAQEAANRQGQNQRQDNDMLNQQVINQLLMNAMLEEQYEKLGIRVTNAEISEAMTGKNMDPAAMQFISSLSNFFGLPEPNGATVLHAIQNPAQYGHTPEELDMVAQQNFGLPTMLAVWQQMENQVEESIKQQVFGNLYAGLFTANDLDAKTIYDHNTNVANVSYVTSPYSSIKDADVEVNDDDLKAKYEELKAQFKVAFPTRDVEYIVVNVVPSNTDLATAEAEVNRAYETLVNDTTGLAVLASNFTVDNNKIARSAMKSGAYASIPDSLIKKGSVYRYPVANNTFRMVRINEVKNQTDSVNISLYQAETKAAADSVFNKIKAGETSIKDLAAEGTNAADSIWQNLVNAPGEIADALAAATIGQPFVYNDSIQNIHLVLNVNKRVPAKDFVDLTAYTYVVDPSANTANDIRTQLSGFLASNSTADLFSANADSLYQKRSASINASTPSLGVPGTRHPIQWAMNAKKGEVSPIFDDNNGQYYVVVAVKDIYDGYVPFNSPQVQEQLKTLVLADKKGKTLVDKYAGKAKSLDEYAKLMNAEVVNDSNVVFTARTLGALGGNQYRLQAQIAGAKPGALVGPVPGNNEVMVFVVNGVEKNERPFDASQDGQAFMSAFGIKDTFNLLAGKRQVKNNLLKIENYENR